MWPFCTVSESTSTTSDYTSIIQFFKKPSRPQEAPLPFKGWTYKGVSSHTTFIAHTSSVVTRCFRYSRIVPRSL